MNSQIRVASHNDLLEINRWLREQQEQGVDDSFLCNWDLTLDQQELFIFIDQNTGLPVAYMWPDFGILEVKNTHRGQGIGQALVEFGINKIVNEDEEFAISLECAPSKSKFFWQKMGFTIYNEKYAYKLIEVDLDFDGNGIEVSVEVNFYPEDKLYGRDASVHPIKSVRTTAVQDRYRSIWLPKRIAVFSGLKEWKGDLVVEILVQGNRLCLAKAKHPEAQRLGVSYSSSCFFLEEITI